MTFNPKNLWLGKECLSSLLQEDKALKFYNFVEKNRGYVYVMAPPNRKDLIKVGLTKHNPFLRAKSLSSTGVMGAFELLWVTEFANVHWAEAKVHKLLTAYHEQKEFFSTTLDHAKKAINHVLSEEQGLLMSLNPSRLPLGLQVISTTPEGVSESFFKWFSGLDIDLLIPDN